MLIITVLIILINCIIFFISLFYFTLLLLFYLSIYFFQPFRPFIITKDQLQKKVIGAGYPSLPTLTVEEFYEQKVKDGTFQIPTWVFFLNQAISHVEFFIFLEYVIDL